MTTFGISSNLIPPLFPKSERLNGITLNDFRAQINRFGADRPTPSYSCPTGCRRSTT